MLHAVQILLLEGWAGGTAFILNSVGVCGELIPAKNQPEGSHCSKMSSEAGMSWTSPTGSTTTAALG